MNSCAASLIRIVLNHRVPRTLSALQGLQLVFDEGRLVSEKEPPPEEKKENGDGAGMFLFTYCRAAGVCCFRCLFLCVLFAVLLRCVVATPCARVRDVSKLP
jgi:hypothetical protein